MPKRKPETEAVTFDGAKLWDEILKSIVSAMPTQLFPLFKEIYGRDYPTDTSIVVLGSETSSFQESSKKPPDSTFMDSDTGEIILYFPRSVVIYPEKNNAIPDNLQCRVVFRTIASISTGFPQSKFKLTP